MNEAHIHLLVNHFPIMGSFFSLILLGAGFILKNATVRKTAYSVLLFSSLMTLPAFFSGEGAEEIVEEIPGMTHDIIHDHEETAELALWISQLAGIAAAFALYFEITLHRLSRVVSIITLVFNLALFGSMTRTGNTGGKIRHPEINDSSVPTAPSKHEEHEDENH